MQPTNYDDIKSRITISEVLDKYVQVPDRTRYRIPCPLHNGTDDNFAVDDDLGLWHCFVCGKGGDLITLYALLEGISNSEAAQKLSQQYQIIERPSSYLRKTAKAVEQYKKEEELVAVNLPINRKLNGYRKYSKEAIEHFDLRLTDDGVLIPLKDLRGRNVGFSIRQINKLPKYKNSYDLKKNLILYGLYENLEDIREKKEVILVEGQFDAIRLWDKGYKNVVSSMGAGLSAEQARLLMPYVRTIVVLYDGDEVGEHKATEINRKYSSLFNVILKHLPKGYDPDSCSSEILLEILNGSTDTNGFMSSR